MIKPRVGSYAVYEPPDEGLENWESQFTQVNTTLSETGLEVIAAPEAVKDPSSCRRNIADHKGVFLYRIFTQTMSHSHK